MAEVLLYGSIYSQSAIEFITSINEVVDEDLTIRINSGGGEVTYGWGMITKYIEFSGKKYVKVDGQASSMAAAFLLYCESSEAVDVSQFVLHRAAYSPWYEKEFMTEDERKGLISMNKSLESAFRAKIDVAKFEEIAGFSLKDMFSLDDRKDITITAQQAKQIGLINKVVKITPERQAKVNAIVERVAASHTGIQEFNISKIVGLDSPEVEPNKQVKMTIEELQAKHPEVYNSVYKQGIEAGVAKENDRVGAFVQFIEVDAKAVKEAIISKVEMNQTKMAEFMLKSQQATALGILNGEGEKEVPGATATPPATDTLDQNPTAVLDFQAKMMASAGVKPVTA